MLKLIAFAVGATMATAAFAAPALVTKSTTVTRTTVQRHTTGVPVHGVTFFQAQAIALRARPGRVTSHRTEMERGAPAFSFNIRSRGRLFEVDVSQRTGEIVENRMKGRA